MEQVHKPWERKDDLDDVKKILGKILRRWPWILLSLAIAVFIAYLFNRYETPIYVTRARIITKKFYENAGSASFILDNQKLFGSNTEVWQEIPLLKSFDRINATIDRLDFDVAYYAQGQLKTTEIYENVWFMVEIDTVSPKIPYNIPIFINLLSEDPFELTTEYTTLAKRLSGQNYAFNTWYDPGGLRFRVLKKFNPHKEGKNGINYFFRILHPASLAGLYRGKLNINWEQEGSAILNLSMQGPLPDKDLDFMKAYIQVVIEKGLEDKNQRATNTIHFIDEQMAQLADSLAEFSSAIDNYKIDNRQLTQGGDYVFTQLNSLEQRQAKIELSNRYYDYLEQYIRQDREEGIFAPNLIGLNAPLLDELVNQYIEIKMQDKLLMNDENEENPLVNRANEKRERVEKNIFESIENMRAYNRQQLVEVQQEMGLYYSTIKDFLDENRELDRMNTIYNLNRELFNLLLQRKTEASISRASTTSDYQVVEEPYYDRDPVYPDTEKNYLIAIMLGLGLPIGLIFLFDVLNDKIVTRDDLLKHTTIPLIGNIGHSELTTNLVVKEFPQSQIAETFRHIRANLKYFIDEKARIFLVTSSFGSEGKTFCSINLAWIYALSGKKTLLLGADMRKPTMTKYLDLSSQQPGLSNYLAGFSKYEEIFSPTDNDFLQVIAGGNVPPNPSELLNSPKMVDLLKRVSKEFEVVIIDTPPIGVVADAMELLKYTDFNLLVVRQGRTIKSSLDHVSEMYETEKISRFGILFNDINFSKYSYSYGYGKKYGYGYGYGYGYYDNKKKKRSLFRNFFNF